MIGDVLDRIFGLPHRVFELATKSVSKLLSPAAAPVKYAVGVKTFTTLHLLLVLKLSLVLCASLVLKLSLVLCASLIFILILHEASPCAHANPPANRPAHSPYTHANPGDGAVFLVIVLQEAQSPAHMPACSPACCPADGAVFLIVLLQEAQSPAHTPACSPACCPADGAVFLILVLQEAQSPAHTPACSPACSPADRAVFLIIVLILVLQEAPPSHANPGERAVFLVIVLTLEKFLGLSNFLRLRFALCLFICLNVNLSFLFLRLFCRRL